MRTNRRVELAVMVAVLAICSAAFAAISGDANGDGTVDLSDLGILATNWGRTDASGAGDGDFTGDSNVDLSDLGILATNWGQSVPASNEWTQHAHDAQHTSYTSQVVDTPWRWKWSFNGPNASGGVSSGKTSMPRPVQPVTGGGRVYVVRWSSWPKTASTKGVVYALDEADGGELWNVNPDSGSIESTPAYDPATDMLYVTSTNGKLYKLNGATGVTEDDFNAGSSISTPPCLAGDRVYISAGPSVFAVDKVAMTQAWQYAAGSTVQTPPAFSPSKDVVVAGSADLYVHGIRNSNGTRKWRVKPSTVSAGSPNEFLFGWPVIAEEHGLVLMKMRLDWQSLWSPSPWPTTNTAIRGYLQSNPRWQALFALDLDDGATPFICNIGHGGYGDGGYMPMGPQPIVKQLDNGDEVVYTIIRGDNRYDGRWDSHWGEMMLDDATVPNLLAGYVRWIEYDQVGKLLTDEQPNVSMAGDQFFGGHWMAGQAIRITNRADAFGEYDNKIQSENLPHIVTSTNVGSFSPTHYKSAGLTQDGDSRSYPPGFYIYFNQGTLYDSYWSGYATWVVSNQTVYYRSCEGSITALEHGDPNSVATATGTLTEWADALAAQALQPPRASITLANDAPSVISYKRTWDHAGETRTVSGTPRYVFNNGKSVLLGFEHPHQGVFKVQIPKAVWAKFGEGFGREVGRNRETLYSEGQYIRVTGKIGWYQGDPCIFVDSPEQIDTPSDKVAAKGE